MRMIDHCGHPDEKRIVKLKHCLITKNSSYTQSVESPKRSKCCVRTTGLLTSAKDSNMAGKSRFENDLREQFSALTTTVALSTACSKTTSTSFSEYFHVCG